MKSLLLICLFVFFGIGSVQSCTPCLGPSLPVKNYPVDPNLISDLNYYFPEGSSPPSAFISDSFKLPRIQFKQAGIINCTFIWEGAGYHNQMGVFTFTVNAQNVVSIVSTQPIFNDIETASTPQCITSGDTVTLGPYAAGTYLGFYIISDGRCSSASSCSGTASTGCTFYSESSLNAADSYKRHVAVFADPNTELIFLGFEDLKIDYSDHDYNDVVFTFHASSTVVDYDGLPWACILPLCQNGRPCDYTSGFCDCSGTVYAPPKCSGCGCYDYDPCTSDTCDYVNQKCSFPNICQTTALQTTGEKTTRQQTTALHTTLEQTTVARTTWEQTTAIKTTRAFTSAERTTLATTAEITTAEATTVIQTTEAVTTGLTGSDVMTDQNAATANNAATGNNGVTGGTGVTGDGKDTLNGQEKVMINVMLLFSSIIALLF